METENLDLQLQGLRNDLFKYVHTLNLDKEEQSLVQDTFIKAIVDRRKHEMEGYLNVWSNILLRKAFINNYRRIMMDDAANNSDGNIFITNTESDEDQELVFNTIVANIEHLNTRLRQPFKMYAEGYNYSEIADTIKIKIETVKRRIFNARQLLLQNI